MRQPFAARLGLLRPDAGYREEGHWVWCGSVIRGGDGRWHMFASRWSREVGFDHWATNSAIVRAASDRLEGPYGYEEEILPSASVPGLSCAAAHNPSVAFWRGRYYLWFTRIRYQGARPGAGDPAPWGSPRSREAWHSKRIALVSAPAVTGPWRLEADPLLDTRPGSWDSLITSNAAPCVGEEGRTLLAYKGSDRGFGSDGAFEMRLRLGLAEAPEPRGPYGRLSDRPLMDEAFPGADWEDPCLWREEGSWWALVKDFAGVAGGQARASSLWNSRDGRDWKVAGAGIPRRLALSGGGFRDFFLLERPQVILEGGRPAGIALAASPLPPDHPEARTCNLVLPLDGEKGDYDQH